MAHRQFFPRREVASRTALLCTVLFALPMYAADPIVGSVKKVQGVSLVQRGAQTLPAREGMHLLAQDVFRTLADGYLGVILQDGTRISLGPNSEAKLEEFNYEPARSHLSLLVRLTRGILTYVSGKIAEFSAQSVRLETPVGVVGLRGTRVAITLEPPPGGSR